MTNNQQVDVSIIIPVYNDERFVGECIDSARKQKGIALEIICIDDGSTDGSVDVIRQKTAIDSRVQLIQQENAGPGPARNRGMDVAHGRYVAFLDSDDFYLDEDALQRMMRFADEHALGMTGAKFYLYTDGTLTWKENHLGYRGLSYDGRIYDHQKDLQKLKRGFTAFLFSLAMLRKYHIEFPANLRNEDPVFIVKASYYAKKIALIDVNLYAYRKYPRKNRNESERAAASILAGSREIITFAADHDLHELVQAEMDSLDFDWSDLILHFLNPSILRDLLAVYRIAQEYDRSYRFMTLERIMKMVRLSCQRSDELSASFRNLISSGTSFYLYGAGVIAKYVWEYLSNKQSTNRIKSILVSEKRDNPPTFHGIPVIAFDEAAELSEDDVILVAVGAGYIREVVQKLRTAGMHRIVTLSVTDKKILGQAFMKFES